MEAPVDNTTDGLPGRYVDWFVLHSVLLCHGLLQDSNMGLVLELAVRTAFPREVAQQLLELMKGMPVPSPASLSRRRLQVDIAYMLWERGLFSTLMDRGTSMCYILCDSSP